MELVEVDREPPELAFLITGIPGSGKTTVAHSLAERFEAAAHIPGDALGDLFVSGRVYPKLPDPDEPEEPEELDEAAVEGNRQLFLRARNAALLCDSFFRAGITPIVDDVVVRRVHLDYYLDEIRSRPLAVVVLAPPVDVVLGRDSGRAKRGIGEQWAFLDGYLREELGDIGIWIDSAEQSPEETVEAVLERTGQALATDEPGRLWLAR